MKSPTFGIAVSTAVLVPGAVCFRRPTHDQAFMAHVLRLLCSESGDGSVGTFDPAAEEISLEN
ncbi:hypothetical protein D6T63_17025 [Arthrobacter cheniae]|uniref:Uncharacterized protein n=1 Tax=Arthrobacter cheniae TaxID=1258888 RepID=A0A3A5LYG9_9MICC|nr:hypothetical protein D6T63_17025 [Arthrobacter cheniae]